MQKCEDIFLVVRVDSTGSLTQRRLARPSYSRVSVQQRQRKNMSRALANGDSKESVHPHIDRVLFTQEQIYNRTTEIGRQLALDYADLRPLLIGTLSGAFMFLADLARAIEPVPEGLQVDFIRASSYIGTSTLTSGSVQITSLKKIALEGRNVLLVEDIVDTGETAEKVKANLLAGGAASVKMVALLDKSSRRTLDITPEYCAFHCPDEFVVGYGLDFNEVYRSLPYVGVLKPELYQ